MICNYEYCEGCQYPLEVIHADISNANYNIHPHSLGVIISNIWNGKVKRISFNSTGPSRYIHLKKRVKGDTDAVIITKFDEHVLPRIESRLCERNEGWMIDHESTKIDALHLRRCYRNSEVTVDGQHLSLEIAITLSPPSITLSTYGHFVPLQVVDRTDEITVSMFSIESAIRLAECSKPCLGRAISSDDFETMVLPVSESRTVTILSSSGKEERLISLSCSKITYQSQACCSNCQYVYTLFRRRRNKRKSKMNAPIPDKKCNVRYLNRMGLEMKVANERKKRKNDVRIEARRKNEESIEFENDDNTDLVKIFESVSRNATIPPDMELLWNQQIKQLSAKSSKGYRWNPRLYKIV